MKEGEEISGDHNAGVAPLSQNLSDLQHKVTFLHGVCQRKEKIGVEVEYYVHIWLGYGSYLYLLQSVHDILQSYNIKLKLIILSDISLVIFINWSK